MQQDTNCIVQGDCLEVLPQFAAESVDCVFADPPYFLQLGEGLTRPDSSVVEGVTNDWDRFPDYAAYDTFTRDWLIAARRVMKPEATLWVIGSYHNIFRVGSILQDLGFWILNDIVWIKSNPMPNFRGTRFTNAHETLIWCSLGRGRPYRFNYQAMKMLNEGVQMRSDWHFPICGGGERLKDGEGRKAHPTQKPEALIAQAMLASTLPGDLVLDPFGGVGSTAAVAKHYRRRYLLIEKETDYIHHAERRLNNIEPLDEDAVEMTPAPRSEKRVPFGQLLSAGLVKPGQSLVSPNERYAAIVRADGSISAKSRDNLAGSIHKVGAVLEGQSAVNGWTYWQLKEGRTRVPLDELRRKLRSAMGGDAKSGPAAS